MYCLQFSDVTPEPITIGKETDDFRSDSSLLLAGSPVAFPVKMMPSERKYSAAFAVSSRDMSLVTTWELKRSLIRD